MTYNRERPWIGSLKNFAKEMRKHSQWMRKALCATPQYQDYPWFTEENAPAFVKKENRKLLKQVCSYCPVQAECNTFAKQAGVTAGVWAGHYYGA